jgi:hypothetical protein
LLYPKNEEAVYFKVIKFSYNYDKIIPFFVKYLYSRENFKDFEDFCKVAELMKTKGHLTEKGLNEIRTIQKGMNRGRD